MQLILQHEIKSKQTLRTLTSQKTHQPQNNLMESNHSYKPVKFDDLYRKYSERILNFISSRIDSREDAENIAQDVWMRMLESKIEICIETVSSYLYKIATNLINDYLRRIYVRNESAEEVERMYQSVNSTTPFQEYVTLELARFEAMRVECLPSQRRIIYKMSRFEEKPVADIAEALQLSFRTVENHLRMGRRDVRDYISAIA